MLLTQHWLRVMCFFVYVSFVVVSMYEIRSRLLFSVRITEISVVNEISVKFIIMIIIIIDIVLT